MTTKDIKFTATETALTVTLPSRKKLVLPTELTFGQTMDMGRYAVLLDEGSMTEAQMFQAMTSGALMPAEIRDQLNDLPARQGFAVFMRWMTEAMKSLEELGGELGESEATSS